MRSAAGTLMLRTQERDRPRSFRMPVRASACSTVRGKPSRMKPFLQSGFARRSFTIPIVTSSGTSFPASMQAFACLPSSVPSFTAARNMSPVEIWGISNSFTRLAACVPLPAPGGPINRICIDGSSYFMKPW